MKDKLEKELDLLIKQSNELNIEIFKRKTR
ncbi:hypothetical protein LCGC14_0458600 [marine sediment metagenome]|uniref:Uncharacterized protein n=1 Tax=marine sediment metagenome TaxID=412755 RepID=A0A0F9SYJ8_9ZZZZ